MIEMTHNPFPDRHFAVFPRVCAQPIRTSEETEIMGLRPRNERGGERARVEAYNTAVAAQHSAGSAPDGLSDGRLTRHGAFFEQVG